MGQAFEVWSRILKRRCILNGAYAPEARKIDSNRPK